MFKKSRIISIIICFIILIVVSYYMSTLLLWSYLPLIFLMSLWFLIIFALFPYLFKGSDGYKRFILSTLSGVLLAGAFPPSVFTPIIFIAFVPLFYSFFNQVKLKGKAAIRPFLWDSYHTFVVWNILSTFWVANSALVPSFVAIWVNSLLMLLPFIITAYAYTSLDSRVKYAGLIAPWVLFEFGHMNWELSWPWLTLGNAFGGLHYIVQWYEFTGVLGGTIWVLLINYFIAQKVAIDGIQNFKLKNYMTPLLWLLIPIIVSLVMYFLPIDSEGERVEFVLVQPNYEPHYEKPEISELSQGKAILSLIDSIYTEDVDYILIPETVFSNVDLSRPEEHPAINILMQWLRKHPNVSIITGVSSYKIVKEKSKYSREFRNGEILYERHNAALEFNHLGLQGYYFKAKFVPGAEIFPYKNFLFFAEPIVDKLGGSIAGMRPSDVPINLDNGKTSVAPIICYESIYGDYVTGYVRRGAEVLAIITNDGWWDDTPGYLQHLSYARLRAIENRKEIARSANTGVSAFINVKGDIIKATQYDERIAIKHTLTAYNIPTFYSKWGDIIGRISLFIVIILLMQLFVSRFKNAKL